MEAFHTRASVRGQSGQPPDTLSTLSSEQPPALNILPADGSNPPKPNPYDGQQLAGRLSQLASVAKSFERHPAATMSRALADLTMLHEQTSTCFTNIVMAGYMRGMDESATCFRLEEMKRLDVLRAAVTAGLAAVDVEYWQLSDRATDLTMALESLSHSLMLVEDADGGRRALEEGRRHPEHHPTHGKRGAGALLIRCKTEADILDGMINAMDVVDQQRQQQKKQQPHTMRLGREGTEPSYFSHDFVSPCDANALRPRWIASLNAQRWSLWRR